MSRLLKLLTGLGIGAAGMYFFDPQQGKRRRALVRDQWTHLKTQMPKEIDRKMRHLQNQAQGAMHELQGTLGSEQSGDRTEESQAGRMQSASRNPSAESGDQYFSQHVAPSVNSDDARERKSTGPGEGGERAPSRQPQTRQIMDL